MVLVEELIFTLRNMIISESKIIISSAIYGINATIYSTDRLADDAIRYNGFHGNMYQYDICVAAVSP